MQTSINLRFLIPAVVVIFCTIGTLVVHLLSGNFRLSRWGIALCAAPSLVQLVLFYSLALHMRLSLGAWPHSIGERGFPPGLLAHAGAATHYFSALVLVTLFVWPVVFLVCLVVRPWRRRAVYLSFHAVAFIVCVCLMLLAPPQFLDWWWD